MASLSNTNRTVCETAKTIIIESELSKSFWTEAVSTAVHVRNCFPTAAHKVMTTLYQLPYDHKPDINNLRVFSSTAFANKPNNLRQKFDKKAEQIIMVGYSLRSKRCCLLDLRQQCLLIGLSAHSNKL